jgi:hypothetical protein
VSAQVPLFHFCRPHRAVHGLAHGKEGSALAGVQRGAVGMPIRRVSRRRLQYVLEAYEESGLSKAQAEHWGLLTYPAFVGALHVMRTAPMMREADELKRYARFLHHALVPGDAG